MLFTFDSSLIHTINNLLIDASHRLAKVYYDYVNSDADIGIQKKSDASPVTKADLLVHRLISDKLAQLTPNTACLSEESEDVLNSRQHLQTLWLLDPVDGTRAFIGKTGEFTMNLALIHEHKVVASWLVVPMQGELYCCFDDIVLNTPNTSSDYTASTIYGMSFKHNIPAEYNDILLASPATSSLTPQLSSVRVETEALAKKHVQTTRHTKRQEPNVIHVGLSRSANMRDYETFLATLKTAYACDVQIVQASSAYKFVQMLRGEIDVYVRAYPTCEWDTASGQGFLECLGGQLINFRGNPFLYNYRDTLTNDGFVCFKHLADRDHILSACKDFK